ncbi:MAG: hypothetical protein HC785_25040 [Calothrix sp. CSU_2_0]|nr:hypothetical protein [Calothrix sp. CSU_2_0]
MPNLTKPQAVVLAMWTGRTSLDITSCFSPLLCWILSLWPEGEKRA